MNYSTTHVSCHDGSPAMVVRTLPHSIVMVNEDGHEWTDPLGWWIPIDEVHEEDRQRWEENADDTRDEWLTGRLNHEQERVLFDAGIITACEFEFGPHDEHSDCDRMMDIMANGYDYDPSYDYPEYDPQTDFFEREGRPMFPNEY